MALPSFTKEPNDVLGAGTPIPMKLKKASKNIALGTVNIDVTTITPNVLGKICLNINFIDTSKKKILLGFAEYLRVRSK